MTSRRETPAPRTEMNSPPDDPTGTGRVNNILVPAPIDHPEVHNPTMQAVTYPTLPVIAPIMSQAWRTAPIRVAFVDGFQLLSYTWFLLSITYEKFLIMLQELATLVAEKLQGLPKSNEALEGLRLNNNAWWYRIAHRGASLPPVQIDQFTYHEAFELGPRGIWIKLSNAQVFRQIMREFVITRHPEGSWIEITHEIQKERDETRPAEIPLVNSGPHVGPPHLFPWSYIPPVWERPAPPPPPPPAPAPAQEPTRSTPPTRDPTMGLFYPPKRD